MEECTMSEFEIAMAIINAIAIIAIPIVAVLVGQTLQDRSQKRKDKMAIFQCLMTHRATGWAHQDTVNAENQTLPSAQMTMCCSTSSSGSGCNP